ncbi:hypothetical protein DU506_03390 [Vreelandella rituensis]|uniref:Uncharacterized protein n=1 Tax=Vreelandella rituensis TaxID=2282306 RepID=A0A368U861_9GAMM|nr:hypothetical protein DU506_03390 [Halomonas rituensis]
MPALLATKSASIKPGEMLMYGNEFPIGNKFSSSFVMVKKQGSESRSAKKPRNEKIDHDFMVHT